MKKNHLIIFFDFSCNLCNNAIYTVQKLDTKKQFLFAPIGGITWNKLCMTSPKDSVLVVQDKKFYWEFFAIRIILQKLPIPWSILGYLLCVVPHFVGNILYRWISKRRKKISCSLISTHQIPLQQILPTVFLWMILCFFAGFGSNLVLI